MEKGSMPAGPAEQEEITMDNRDYERLICGLERVQKQQKQQGNQALRHAYDAYQGLMRGTALAEEVHALAEVLKKAGDAGLDIRMPDGMVFRDGASYGCVNRFEFMYGSPFRGVLLYENGYCDILRNTTTTTLYTNPRRAVDIAQFRDFCTESGFATPEKLETFATEMRTIAETWKNAQESIYTELDKSIEQALSEKEIPENETYELLATYPNQYMDGEPVTAQFETIADFIRIVESDEYDIPMPDDGPVQAVFSGSHAGTMQFKDIDGLLDYCKNLEEEKEQDIER